MNYTFENGAHTFSYDKHFETKWDNNLLISRNDKFFYWVIGLSVWTPIVYCAFGSLYLYFDLTDKPHALRKYKLQRGVNEPVETAKLKQMIGTVIFNLTVMGPLVFYATFKVFGHLDIMSTLEVPTIGQFFQDFLVALIVEEIAFYYSHRLLHNKHIYSYIHKKHHEWTAPIAVATVYCHPLEHVISNVLPIYLGVHVSRCSIFTAYIWGTLGIAVSMHSHCGYSFPYFPISKYHDFHHMKFKYCYGVIGLLDVIHGTLLPKRKSASRIVQNENLVKKEL